MNKPLSRLTAVWLTTALLCLGIPVVRGQSGSVVTVNGDNVLVINGQKVFPIGFSPGPPNNSTTPQGKDALQEFRDAGALLFRIVQTNNWNSQLIAQQQAALDWAAQHGMYLWLNLRELSQFSSTDTSTPASLRNIVDTFRNHPALGLWKNFDEAWLAGVSVANLSNGFYVIKQKDRNHPVVQTHAPRGTVADLRPYNVAADVLALDIYPVAIPAPSNPPITNTGLSQLGDWTKVLGQVANGQKEYWMVEQIAFSGTTPPARVLIFPTFQQSRYMAYEAIINGARGLMFFGGNIAATLNAQDAPYGWNWTFWTNVLKPVVLELGDHGLLSDALLTTNSALPIALSGTTVPDIEYIVREAPPYLYLLASKREGTNVTATFSGLPASAGTGDVLYESPRTVVAHNGRFSDTFAPSDVHVYRFFAGNPPAITSQPQGQVVMPGQSVAFAVSASGTGPLAYQWSLNGTPVAGATNSVFALPSVKSGDGGAYSVTVTNWFGVVPSSNAVLGVTLSGGWGDNGWGQIQPPGVLTNIIAVAAGAYHNLILRTDGTVSGWGNDWQGQCDSPAGLHDALAIAAGGYHSLAIRADGSVVAWGLNDSGQSSVPPGLRSVVGVSGGTWHSLALKRDGSVAAWGDNSFGQATVPAGLRNVVACVAGGSHNLALRADGSVVAWGNDTGADSLYAGQSDPPLGLTNVIAIGAGEYHSLAVKADGTVAAWGDDSEGQCDVPAGLTNVVAVAGGGAHSLALRGDGTVVAWGANWSGQCAVMVGLTNVLGVGAGENHSAVFVAGSAPTARLLSPTVQNGHFSAVIQTLNRTHYALDGKNALTLTNWTGLATNVGNGALKVLLDPSPPGAQRFYRQRQW